MFESITGVLYYREEMCYNFQCIIIELLCVFLIVFNLAQGIDDTVLTARRANSFW